MEIDFDEEAQEELQFCKKLGNATIQPKIQNLLSNIIESHYSGLGKPEVLKYDLAGKWPRRINK